MSKFFAILAASAAFNVPAMAAVMTVEFSTPDGAQVRVYDTEAMTVTLPDGTSYTYTFDEATNEVCPVGDTADVCYSVDTVASAVGETFNYTAANGFIGVGTVTAIE